MNEEKKKIYTKWWFWVIIIILVFIIMSNSFKSGLEQGINNTQNIEIPETVDETISNEDKENLIYTAEVTEEDYMELVKDVFDKYYPDSYVISSNRSNWTIASNLDRVKLKGYTINYSENKLFEIILVFTDKDTYSVETFEVDHINYK